jgi:hypothetical protein
MRKPIYCIGACALVAAAAIFVWSQNGLVSSRANAGKIDAAPDLSWASRLE